MRKVFYLFAIAAMVAVACSKDDDNKNGGNNKGGDSGEYVQPIAIDGDFSDWAKLDATKVATAKNAGEDANHTALKLVKVYADPYFVFVYFEIDEDQIADRSWVPFHIYWNGDGNDATGGYGDQWTDASVDVLFEGAVFADGEWCSYDPGAFNWIGEVNGLGWSWCDPALLPEGSGLCQGAGKGNAYELLFMREMYPVGKLADNFTVGFDIQQNWNSVGVLPNLEMTDDNPNGLAPMLKVTTVK